MITFKCNACGRESNHYHKSTNNGEVIPSHWITISGATIHNEDKYCDRAVIYSGGENIHLCSKRCLMNYFYKENQATNDNNR